jgi:serralysin
VPATSSVTPSGISYVDYVDSGMKWATGNLTYSFPTSASFYVGMNGSAYGSGE